MPTVSVFNFGPPTISLPWDYEVTAYPGNSKDINNITYTGPSLTLGTGAGNANIKYSAQLLLAAAASTTLALTGLTDNFGNVLSFARIKDLYIENSAQSSASVVSVGGAGTTPFAGIWSPGSAVNSVRNGASMHHGCASDATGYVVGAGVNLQISNGDTVNAAKVNVLIVGVNT